MKCSFLGSAEVTRSLMMGSGWYRTYSVF